MILSQFLGHFMPDGMNWCDAGTRRLRLPAWRRARFRGVATYGGRVVPGRVAQVRRDGPGFALVTEDSASVWARRVLVTTGLTDALPDVPGLVERWGRDVLHCVYCHGWEVRDRPIGVLGSFHQAPDVPAAVG